MADIEKHPRKKEFVKIRLAIPIRSEFCRGPTFDNVNCLYCFNSYIYNNIVSVTIKNRACLVFK